MCGRIFVRSDFASDLIKQLASGILQRIDNLVFKDELVPFCAGYGVQDGVDLKYTALGGDSEPGGDELLVICGEILAACRGIVVIQLSFVIGVQNDSFAEDGEQIVLIVNILFIVFVILLSHAVPTQPGSLVKGLGVERTEFLTDVKVEGVGEYVTFLYRIVQTVSFDQDAIIIGRCGSDDGIFIVAVMRRSGDGQRSSQRDRQ